MRLDDHSRASACQDIASAAESLYGAASALALYVRGGGKVNPEGKMGKASNAALKRLLRRLAAEAIMLESNTKPARYLALASLLRQAADEAEALAGPPVARKVSKK